MFASELGTFLDGSALRRRYKVALERARLRPLRFHDLRHTFGTRMIAKADIRRVQEWMGHADIQTTMRYLHYAPREEDARLVAEAFGLTRPWFATTSRQSYQWSSGRGSDVGGTLAGPEYPPSRQPPGSSAGDSAPDSFPDSYRDSYRDWESRLDPRPTCPYGLVCPLTSRPQRRVCEVKNQTRNVTGFGGELRVEKKTNQRTGEGQK